MILLFSLIVPIGLIGIILKKLYPEQYSWKEYGVTISVVIFVCLIGYMIAMHSQTSDIEILSGKVTDKKKERVGCRHSYSCNCHTSCYGSGASRKCSTVCQTCHQHTFDNDWNIKSTIGNFTIDTIDKQGLKEPPRWTSVKINDPVASQHGYKNYLKAVPNSVYKRVSTKPVPEYPQEIFDYYQINRIIDDGVKVPKEKFKKLNMDVAGALKDIAITKQVNLVIVLTKEPVSTYAQDVQAAWLNGRKNDLVVVIGSSKYPAIDWVDVFGWSANDMAQIATRDAIMDYGSIDEQIITIAIDNIKQYWVRKPMEDFNYLSDEIELSTTVIIILIIVALSTMVGVSIFAIKNGENNDFF